MNKATGIRCHCGQRILRKDVLHYGFYVKLFGPSYVYLKFRCSRCKKIGEEFVEKDKWNENMLHDRTTEMTDSEKKKFNGMGKIDISEMVEFHHELENLTSLEDLKSDA